MSEDYSKRLNAVIPGGAHTYSRGDDQYPLNAPPILEKGKGAYIWDAYGNRYLDYGMALRAITLGYANDEVDQAAFEEMKKGNNLTRPSTTELVAAETLRDLIPGMDMVKFAKNGSNVTSAALKLARAYTGRKYIVVCAEQPFFSFDDWFIGSTAIQRGIPEEHYNLTLKFNYNNIESLRQLFDMYPGQIAGVMLEPATSILDPCANCDCDCPKFRYKNEQVSPCSKQNFLQKVKDLCQVNGAVFILDEMISGFRWHLQGAQKYYGVIPDLTTFGKGMANGYSVSALVGKREIMELGGISSEGMERTFSISTTHGAEMNGLGAFLKTIEIYKRDQVTNQLWDFGTKLIDGFNDLSKDMGILDKVYFEGFPCSPNYTTKDTDGNVSLAFRTLFSQEMIKNKILMPWIAPCFMHQEDELSITLEAARKVIGVYSEALNNGIENYLVGRPIKPVFRKYN
jgi:glutamate-1-semialdehyde 2,1-aminomutase